MTHPEDRHRHRSPNVRAPLAFLLRPGLHLMRSMRMPAKMGLVGAMLAIPLFLLLALAMLQARDDMAIARAEREGTVLAQQVTELALLVQTHRSLSNQVSAGMVTLTPARDALRAKLRRAVQHEIEDVLSEKILHGELGSGEHVTVDFADNEFVFTHTSPESHQPELAPADA